jgi:hypothetical protein
MGLERLFGERRDKPMARLEKWSLVGVSTNKPIAVRGEIRGDERFADGTPITSSRLLYLDPDGRIASTRNHTYELGTINAAFARWMSTHGRTLDDFARTIDSHPSPAASIAPIAPPRARTTLPELTRVLVQEPTVRIAG